MELLHQDREEIRQEIKYVLDELQQPKWLRIFKKPTKYLLLKYASFVNSILNYSGSLQTVKLIFGSDFNLRLPSNADVYLYGCRATPSDLALSLLIINASERFTNLIDVGAHYGFFSLLYSKVSKFRVYAIEPSLGTYQVLKKNCQDHPGITTFNSLIHENQKTHQFYEFPTKYSEYNTTSLNKFHAKNIWSSKKISTIRKVVSTTLDKLLINSIHKKAIIKIDTEEDSLSIVKGASKIIEEFHPVFIIRYWYKSRNNKEQTDAIKYLTNLGYNINILSEDGTLKNLYSDISKLKNYSLEYIYLSPETAS